MCDYKLRTTLRQTLLHLRHLPPYSHFFRPIVSKTSSCKIYPSQWTWREEQMKWKKHDVTQAMLICPLWMKAYVKINTNRKWNRKLYGKRWPKMKPIEWPSYVWIRLGDHQTHTLTHTQSQKAYFIRTIIIVENPFDLIWFEIVDSTSHHHSHPLLWDTSMAVKLICQRYIMPCHKWIEKEEGSSKRLSKHTRMCIKYVLLLFHRTQYIWWVYF